MLQKVFLSLIVFLTAASICQARWGNHYGEPPSLALTSSDGQLVSLTDVSFDGTIIDGYSMLALSLSFKNNANESFADVSLRLPTDPRAAVFNTIVRVGNRPEIKMQMHEREEAEKIFADAKDKGDGAYIAARDYHQADVTRIGIGNLPPNEVVRVTIHYVADLVLESESSLRFSLPVGMIHRYYPISRSSFDPSHGEDDVVVPISVHVQLNMSSPIKNITSSTNNPFEMTFLTSSEQQDGHKHARQIANITSNLNSTSGEYALSIKFDQPLPATLFVVEEEKEEDVTVPGNASSSSSSSWDVVLAELVGDKAWAQQQQGGNEQIFEVFFVIDQSGSMSGEGNKLAIETLFMTVSSLPQGSLFQIIAFGSDYKELFPELAEFSDETKATAMAYSRTLDADLGGTEILAPLEAIARKYPHGRLPRYVFVLTDGEVGNTDEVIDFVRKDHRASGTRYFSFGIGAGASRALCEGIAEASLGVAEMITGHSHSMSIDISTKTSRQLKRIMAPTLTDVQVSLSSSSAPLQVLQQTPVSIAPLFQESRQLVFFEMAEHHSAPLATGSLGGLLLGNVSIATPISHIRSMPAKMLRVLAARAFIKELESQYDHLGAMALGQEDTEYKQRQLKSKAVSLSVTHNVASKFTSQVAVEERSEAERASSKGEDKIVRNMFLSRSQEAVGYDGELLLYEGYDFSFRFFGEVDDGDYAAKGSIVDLLGEQSSNGAWNGVQEDLGEGGAATDLKAVVFDLLGAQSSNGAWKALSPHVEASSFAAAAVAAVAVAAAATTATKSDGQLRHLQDEAVLNTLLTIKFLETRASSFFFLWSLTVNKGARFVASITGWQHIEVVADEKTGLVFGGLQLPDEVRSVLMM